MVVVVVVSSLSTVVGTPDPTYHCLHKWLSKYNLIFCQNISFSLAWDMNEALHFGTNKFYYITQSNFVHICSSIRCLSHWYGGGATPHDTIAYICIENSSAQLLSLRGRRRPIRPCAIQCSRGTYDLRVVESHLFADVRSILNTLSLSILDGFLVREAHTHGAYKIGIRQSSTLGFHNTILIIT